MAGRPLPSSPPPDRSPLVSADVAFLADPAAPPIAALPVAAAVAAELRVALPAQGYLVRELRGSRMRTVPALFDEFAAAWQFPYYFGGNKDAFDECLRDLDEWVGPAAGYVVVLRDAAELLADVPAERAWFDAAMADAAAYWSVRDVAFRLLRLGPPAGYPVLAG